MKKSLELASLRFRLPHQSINCGHTIQGVQKKLSLGISKNKNKRLTLVNDPVGYILKLESKNYKEIVMVEFVSMSHC